ncbi:hypothetical protein Tco_1082668 [Tanacetum coccineum]|uniref:Uncharacterized protein n=1 Tax=Tanacetum coccineum TaxID=301880 RepID=A0ABQ5I1A8_9ASTR
MNKQDCNFTTSISENLSNKHLDEGSTSQEIQADIYDTDLNESCIQENQLHDELKYGAYNTISKTHWCEPVRQRGYAFWANSDLLHEEMEGIKAVTKIVVRARYTGKVNDITKERILQKYWDSKLGGRTWENTITKDQEDPEKCKETMTRAIVRAMVNKLHEEWFSGVSEDKDDLEGIIDYLEPTLYDGLIDPC